MPECLNPNIWLWKEPDFRWKNKVLEHVRTLEPVDGDIVILQCSDISDFEESVPVINYMFNICQQFKIFTKEKVMFLNPKDFLQAVELCLERLKSENNISETEVTTESVIECHEAYISSLQTSDNLSQSVSRIKEFLTQNNCIDLWQLINSLQVYKANNSEFVDYVSKLKFLLLGTPQVKILNEIISLLGNSEVILSITVETPLDISLHGSPSEKPLSQSSSDIHVTSEPSKIHELCFEIGNEMHLGSATEEYVEDVITSFLSLVINSRNEFALSKVMISPFIDLSHAAFTQLKHMAIEKEMPMCQTAISYVTRMRLGGKGYAPSADCPMLPHLKSLELFVDTLNQIQTVVEEDSVPKTAIKRLINILKKKLLKCGSSKLKPASIEAAAKNLSHTVIKVLNLMKSKQCVSAAPQICQETLDVLYYLVNFINCSCWAYDPKTILVQKQSERTPINLPPLLGYFRSPEEESTCEVNSVIEEDSLVSNNSSLGFPAPLMSYFHHSDNSCSASMTCTETNTPTKTTFKNCIYEDECVEPIELFSKPKEVNNRKRSILGDITNESGTHTEESKNISKKLKTDSGKGAVKVKEVSNKKNLKKEVKKTKLSKKFKLIEGQGKITKFFIKK